jgi:teichuronic acid biosynthesis glycosyltransferase TuaG
MRDVNFTIILPTFNRPDTVSKSIDSVLNQTYVNWQLLVIIDDEVEKYKKIFDTYKNENRITFLTNPKNIGKNQSLNHALDYLKKQSFNGFIVFLDDDDWLSPECLKDFTRAMIENSEINWLVSERANADTKQPYTINKTGRNIINYETDMLLRRQFTGDTTQCLHFETFNKIRFSTLIKNAEEWLYFAEIAKTEKSFLFLPVIGTYSIGYATDGLTYNYHNKKESWKNNLLVLKELRQRELFSLPIIIYFTVRLLKSLLK